MPLAGFEPTVSASKLSRPTPQTAPPLVTATFGATTQQELNNIKSEI
jgi:hypothetical protein